MTKICILIPTYNNDKTLSGVIDDVLRFTSAVIVVNDGSTDRTAQVLETYGERIMVVSYSKNRGKGHALARGFGYALSKGFDHAITLDADGQHFAEDIPAFVRTSERHPDAIITGSRNLLQDNMPGKNTFANRFSNFWFTVQTARRLPDTQTGYRLYPLSRIGRMRFFTSRYETELEILVRSTWRGIPVIPIPVKVYYAPEGERVSHFRPVADFVRISLLNAAFTLLAAVYGYPSMLFYVNRKQIYGRP
ncbi:MAG: glycosyltransferase family 2 protein [Bacteroidales bacterium]|jgi:glycosyltransferase involved in cell wall biosynthesis|nr:glycosyltransferase family 2 protein [Bacteroidales bacterium]